MPGEVASAAPPDADIFDLYPDTLVFPDLAAVMWAENEMPAIDDSYYAMVRYVFYPLKVNDG